MKVSAISKKFQNERQFLKNARKFKKFEIIKNMHWLLLRYKNDWEYFQ